MKILKDLIEKADDTLDEVGKGCGQESAQSTVGYDNHGTQDHSQSVVHTEQGGEQLTAGGKAGGGVRNEENNDKQSRDQGQHAMLITKATGKEVGQGEGVHTLTVYAQGLGHEQPVEVCTDGKTDGGPRGLGQSTHQGNGGKTHQEPSAHIGGLCAHGRDVRAKRTAAQEKAAC